MSLKDKISYLEIVLILICLIIGIQSFFMNASFNKRISTLEYYQEMNKPNIMWLINSMETMFTMSSYDYLNLIDVYSKQYCTPNSIKAYREILTRLGAMTQLSQEGVVQTTTITSPPIAYMRSISEAPDKNYGFSEKIHYKVDAHIIYQSGATVISVLDVTFNVAIARIQLKDNSSYIITDLDVASVKNDESRLRR
ncbi:MAG: hypothetical protein ACK4NR_08415 [Micavibrio sp.]